MKVYVNKENMWEYLIFPAPSNLEDYIEVELTEEEVNSIKMDMCYCETAGKFVCNYELAVKHVHAQRRYEYVIKSDPLMLAYQSKLLREGEAAAAEDKLIWEQAVEAVKEKYPLPDPNDPKFTS